MPATCSQHLTALCLHVAAPPVWLPLKNGFIFWTGDMLKHFHLYCNREGIILERQLNVHPWCKLMICIIIRDGSLTNIDLYEAQ